jgi:hypothetical protein
VTVQLTVSALGCFVVWVILCDPALWLRIHSLDVPISFVSIVPTKARTIIAASLLYYFSSRVNHLGTCANFRLGYCVSISHRISSIVADVGTPCAMNFVHLSLMCAVPFPSGVRVWHMIGR